MHNEVMNKTFFQISI